MSTFAVQNQKSSVSSILRGLVAFGSAELANRIVRILVVIIIARQLAPDLVGVAALTLSLFELIRVIANIGVGQKIIAAHDSDLAATCIAAHRIFWIWCSIVAAIQLVAAALLHFYFEQSLAAQMLAILCGVYFFMPGGLVQCFRLMRTKKLAKVAKIGAVQTITDHILTGILVFIWASPWAIVIPKLMTAPLWLVMMRHADDWRPDLATAAAPYKDMLNFGAAILATDIFLAVRNNLDKLIISAFLGVSALGTYYFAFNAGIGIVSALATAFGTVIFPHLCNKKDQAQNRTIIHFSVAAGLAIFGSLTAVQYFLAPIYVPIIFGSHWVHAIPLIQVLSLAGIPLAMSAIASAYLRAEGRAPLDAWFGLTVCVLALMTMLIGAQWGLLSAATGWVLGTSIVIISYTLFLSTQPVSKFKEVFQ
ncbi:MAG: oligosaccharide flippase family protein [Parasphingorhabdus sp.]|uniref:oligosaccharide flippase family protein n=1 Tax=Parasphingorhabdus sp. TaxID=2709688 RepID=UPI0032994B03